MKGWLPQKRVSQQPARKLDAALLELVRLFPPLRHPAQPCCTTIARIFVCKFQAVHNVPSPLVSHPALSAPECLHQPWLAVQVISLGLSAAALWWALRQLKNAQNPVTASQRAAKKRLCHALGIAPSELHLDEHEYAHMSKIVLPQNIAVTLRDVAGSDDILAQLRRDIAFSCSVRPTSATSLLAGSKGLLLYGPPGTGKTMIASVSFRSIQHAVTLRYCGLIWCSVLLSLIDHVAIVSQGYPRDTG